MQESLMTLMVLLPVSDSTMCCLSKDPVSDCKHLAHSCMEKLFVYILNNKISQDFILKIFHMSDGIELVF